MLTSEELTAILALYQQVSLQEKEFSTGKIPLEMSFAMFSILNRIHNAAEFSSHPVSSEQQQLLRMLKKVQHVSINGKSVHRTCDVDMICFPNLFSLRLEKLSVRAVLNATMVVDLSLVDCVVEEDFFTEAFIALRSLELERTPLPSKFLASLAYTLRRFSVKHNDTDFDKTLWRDPPGDIGGNGLIRWQVLTHVSIRTHRPLFTELDGSWERLNNLTCLSLTSMQLTDLKGLDVLKKCIYLNQLDLSYNALTSVHRLSTFAANVQRLNVSYNSISSVAGLPDLKELRHLSLEGNTIHEWAELRDVAEGCKNLVSLSLRGNPILSQIDEQSEVIPFVASIFQFRPLVVDGVKSESTRGKVNAAFLGKHIGLFERNRSVDGVNSEMSAPVRLGGAASVRGASAATEGRRPALRRAARSLPSDTGADGPRRRVSDATSASPSPQRPKRRVVRGKVMPDKQEEVIALPSPQLDTVDRSSPSYVDVENLAEKHKERWLTAVSAQAAVSQRSKKKKEVQPPPEPAEDDAQQKVTRKRGVKVTNAAPPTAVAAASSPVVASPTPKSATPAAALSSSASFRRTAPAAVQQHEKAAAAPTGSINDDEDVDQAAVNAAAVAHVISSQMAAGSSSGKVAGGIAKPQRQAPQRDPTPLFQSFLHNLASLDWSFVRNDQRARGFPSGCNTYVSAICAENEALWGVQEDDITSPTVHHTAVEVVLHDANDGEHKFGNRHLNKKLLRVMEYHTGYTRIVRVERAVYEDKTSLPVFEKRPVVTVTFLSPLPTQPADPHIEVRSGQPQRQKRGSFNGRDRSNSELDWADRDVDTSKISREVLRVTRPTILAAFVVENSALGDVFVDVLKRHLESCHSRLCETKILREWPLYLDESAVKRDSDRSVPLKMTVANVLDRVKNYTDEDINRQRIGCPEVMINGEELRINLTTEVFSKELGRERFLANVYGNLVSKDSDLDESAVLMIVTQKIFLLAYDRNYKGRGGSVTTDSTFEKVDLLPIAQVRSISVSFNLQTIQINQHVVQTRESGATLAIVGSLLTASNNTIEVNVRRCPYEDITAAPLIFSVGLFMRSPGMRRRPDNTSSAFPLRHIGEMMVPVNFVVTATDIHLLMEMDAMTDFVSVKKLEKRPLTTIAAFGVAVQAINPLLFSLVYNNLEKGKREQWIFAAQHPNTVGVIYQELRQCLGQRLSVVDLTEKQYMESL